MTQKGVSTVIGNLLVLMGSVVMASIVMFWSLSFQGGSQASYSTSIFQSNAQASEQLSIDDAFYNSSGTKTITVYVRNFGDIPLTVAQIYVDAQNYTLITPSSQRIIVSRASANIRLQYSSWTSGETHMIRVATHRGNIYEKSFLVP
ncbi:MAG: hypothetical protein HYU39_05315 [Thaumarchaeota archaeon]|nr:hypothetical protein [Nitrososphaerota archaeon]